MGLSIRASMGPSLFRTEDSGYPGAPLTNFYASMGPSLFRTEDCCSSPEEVGWAMLQWGRPYSGRKTSRGNGVLAIPLTCFNGAVLIQDGRRGNRDVQIRRLLGFNGAVLIQDGRPSSWSDSATWSAGFNGAVLIQDGRPPAFDLVIWREVRDAVARAGGIGYRVGMVCQHHFNNRLPRNRLRLRGLPGVFAARDRSNDSPQTIVAVRG